MTLRERIEAAERGSPGESPLADVPHSRWQTRRLVTIGLPGERDADAPCTEFDPGKPTGRGDCSTDGHYMCAECKHAELCEGCGELLRLCECTT